MHDQQPDSQDSLPTQMPWLPVVQAALNDDYTLRAESLPISAQWIPTGVPGVLALVLEFSATHQRFTAVLQLQKEVDMASLTWCDGLEVFVCEGSLSTGSETFPKGTYLRIPNRFDESADSMPAFTITADPVLVPTSNPNYEGTATLLLAGGQIQGSDAEERCIDTTEPDRWLPGPVEGTEVLPLHVHGASNAMLVRWTADVSFHPKLDPQGEEVYVLSGELRDVDGTYHAGSWIRNPVPSWQAWSGQPGTMIFYKSGHFIDCL